MDNIKISIHAPTRGATSLKATEYKLSIDFNPRSHERSDNFQFSGNQSPDCISIHAPTRGATYNCLSFKILLSLFQSTLPREERLIKPTNKSVPKNFNPRSHERSDCNSAWFLVAQHISIHAPTRGATLTLSTSKVMCLFQSTLPREERLK